MSRVKTISFWIFVVLGLGVGIYAYFNLKNNKKPNLDALSVIPDNCLVYLNTHDFFELNKKINSQSLIADKLKLFDDPDLFCSVVHSFDSLFNTDEFVRDVIKDNTIHFALYGKKNNWLATLNIKQSGRQTKVAEHLAQVLHATKTEADIYKFTLHKKTFHFNLTDGVVTISNAAELIVQALNKTEVKLETNKAFISFKSTLAENSLLSIYVNHELYSQSTANGHLNLSYACQKGFSVGNIDLQPSQLKVNGYVLPGESELFSLFAEQQASPSDELPYNLPFNTAFFKAFGFSSYPDLRIEFPLTNIHIKFWIKANERGLYNVEDDFNSNLVNHVIDFQTAYPKQNIISVEINDTLKAAEHLKHMGDSLIRTDSLFIYRMYRHNEDPLQLFIPLSNTITHYALLYNNHLYFSDNSYTLVQLVRDLKNNNLLSTNESFMSYKSQHFFENFNYLVYGSPNQMIDEIPGFFNFKNDTKENPFENFKHLSYSVSRHKGNFKFRFHLLNESETRTRDQNVLWTMNLDSTASMPASGFVNHITGENEIVVQDNNNVLYLINAKGTLLWKKKLNEKIISTIYTVDIYKKNKFQLLFNTKNQLHLIDRNGNYVEKYPVTLPAEASSSLALFDYDTNKDYRLFISCKNNTIYNYSIHGITQDKFVPVKTDNEVTLPVQYVKVGASDYLVALDVEGKIYTFSRKGVGRIGLRNRTISNCKAFYTDASNSINSTYLVYLDDKSGLLSKISFDDRKEIVSLHSETENAFVNFGLVDNNKNMDLILSKRDVFKAFNFTGNLIVEKKLKESLGETNYYSDESHSVFYSLSEDKTQVIVSDLLKGQSKTLKATAMPLISNLFKDNKKYLILTNGRQLNCVLLN